jgi:hypothetical protein
MSDLVKKFMVSGISQKQTPDVLRSMNDLLIKFARDYDKVLQDDFSPSSMQRVVGSYNQAYNFAHESRNGLNHYMNPFDENRPLNESIKDFLVLGNVFVLCEAMRYQEDSMDSKTLGMLEEAQEFFLSHQLVVISQASMRRHIETSDDLFINRLYETVRAFNKFVESTVAFTPFKPKAGKRNP